MTHAVRDAFVETIGQSDSERDLGVICDVAHNIAKFEEHEGRSFLVHCKGAQRSISEPGVITNAGKNFVPCPTERR